MLSENVRPLARVTLPRRVFYEHVQILNNLFYYISISFSCQVERQHWTRKKIQLEEKNN